MKRAFLCHGWPDATLVAKFGEELEKRGLPVFLDKWDIGHGMPLWPTIDKGIDEASRLVIFLSRDALSGKGVNEEIDRGLQKAYECHGEVFIVPVAIDPYEDIAPLLPIRVRAANMVRAFEVGLDAAIDQLASAIKGDSLPRVAASIPTDFYYRIYQSENALVVELGTGLPIQEGFGFETIWPTPVKYIEAGMGPKGNPSQVPWGAGMWQTAAGYYIPPHPDTRLCPAFANRTIRRNESFYIAVATSDGKCPPPPSEARLYDHYQQLVRARLPLVGQL